MTKPANIMRHVPSINSGTISPGNASIASAYVFTVTGKVPSLKNRRRILKNRRTGKPFSAKSEAASRYMQDFVAQVPLAYRNLRLGGPKAPLRIVVTLFAPSYRQDVDVEAVYDGLQLSGMISNDRWLREKTIYSEIDKAHPRCEIILEEM